MGNRLSSDKIKAYVYNQGNQLIINGGTYNYDRNGNLVQKTTSTGTTYTWDYENRLVKVTTSDGTIAEFAYDPFGRRIQKKVTQSGTTTSARYFYDNQNIILEYDGAGAVANKYVHGPSIDEPLAVTTGKDTYFYHADGLGSIVALTDQAGKVVQTYEYDSFGHLKDLKNKVKQPFTYVGKEYDRETGLIRMGVRYYDPMEGRFISTDPAGFIDGTNLFAYARNNPINYTDPFGLSATSNDSCFVGCWKKCIDDNYGSSFKTALGLSYLGVAQIVQEIYNGVVSIAAADKLKSLSLEGAFTSGNIAEKMQAAEKASCAAKHSQHGAKCCLCYLKQQALSVLVQQDTW